jgi:hypothetical protein
VVVTVCRSAPHLAGFKSVVTLGHASISLRSCGVGASETASILRQDASKHKKLFLNIFST